MSILDLYELVEQDQAAGALDVSHLLPAACRPAPAVHWEPRVPTRLTPFRPLAVSPSPASPYCAQPAGRERLDVQASAGQIKGRNVLVFPNAVYLPLVLSRLQAAVELMTVLTGVETAAHDFARAALAAHAQRRAGESSVVDFVAQAGALRQAHLLVRLYLQLAAEDRLFGPGGYCSNESAAANLGYLDTLLSCVERAADDEAGGVSEIVPATALGPD